MTHNKQNREFYDALLRKDSKYDGIIFYGIRTTGVFCRSVCTARKPKFENCEFFRSASEALHAGYRACKKCHPTGLPNELSDWAKMLIDAVEAEPERRWSDQDLRALGVEATTVRRHFKKRFGMTFVAYARARRMGLALQQIRAGSRVVDVQLAHGYDSESGFRDAFSRVLGAPPTGFKGDALKACWIDTPIGAMLAVASDVALCLLEFTDRRGLEREIERLQMRTHSAIVPGTNNVLESIEAELRSYFAGRSLQFQTPIELIGSEFQKAVWNELGRIPVGAVRSYTQQARAIGSAHAVRAVARANGANQLAIIVPCHRVVGTNGDLTGYAGGLARKAWLLEHERNHSRVPVVGLAGSRT